MSNHRVDSLARVQLGGVVKDVVTDPFLSATREFARRDNRSIQSLLLDIHNDLVWAYPARLRDLAKAAPGGFGSSDLLKLADQMDARSVGRSDEQINNEVSYSTAYQEFVNEWDIFFDSLQNDIIAPAAAISQMDAYDSEYRQFYNNYPARAADGTKKPPSLSIAKTEDQITAEHPQPGLFGLLGDIVGEIPWGTIAVAGAVVGGGYLLLKKFGGSDSPTVVVQQEPKTEGP